MQNNKKNHLPIPRTNHIAKVFPRRQANIILDYIKSVIEVNDYGKYVLELDVADGVPVNVKINSSANFKVRDA